MRANLCVFTHGTAYGAQQNDHLGRDGRLALRSEVLTSASDDVDRYGLELRVPADAR